MKTIQKTLNNFNIWACFSFTLILASCDFSTHEYFMYSNNEDSDNEIYFLWGDSLQCGVTIKDSSIKYDELKLYFPSDKSIVKSHCESYYDYVRDSLDVIVDSVEICVEYFDISEFDSRIMDNDHVIMYISNRNSIFMVDTLLRKKVEQSFIDRLPLPKLH